MRTFNYVAQNEKKVVIEGHVYPLKPATLNLIDAMLKIKDTAESDDQISTLKAEYDAVAEMLGSDTTENILGTESGCDLRKLQALFEFLAAEYNNESAD